MGRAPCCLKVGLRRGPWTLKEDNLLIDYIRTHGEGHWRSLPKKAGLLRCGKSCRLRWMNYLRPDIKRGNITADEEDLIIRLHSLLGNRWSLIAGRLPGRTDNEIKNYWNSHLSKRVNADKPYRSPKTRNDATNITKRNTRSPKNAEEINMITKIKVHQPKAVRLSFSPSSVLRNGRNSSYDNCVGEMSASGEGKCLVTNLERAAEDVDADNDQCENLMICSGCNVPSSSGPWHDDVNHILLPGTPSNREMLEKIFEEYQELLMAEDHVQLESFVDSLLV
ncbi:transcription factor MYB1-like [Punica granatum]|uniref:Transcription factor MYB1-like n=1 Tax=Punica granatum TaxID=22663 RepID=A0A218XKF7_PUNGR|nr:transcription factor MYB1-like [Punica granatum]OWM85186.1 hypothetical protein CDL15_Pgr027973 [Punica granatum]